ncbi:alpha/beta fold hydrolase [Streptomyces niger]|uniref:alpha/beta fold hydrolase n=1 Tax=Streptomyces niger TaxID=66373 RepID=UPI00069AEF27|nr:alpha/beta fold hydrolase [Streptomyces niger]
MAAQRWRLTTGSRVAVYHYPPAAAGPRHPTPLVYLNGGPVRGISLLDHRFLQLLARQGYDVYAYEQAGGGRSDLLPTDQYTISRSVRDFAAFVDRLDRGEADMGENPRAASHRALRRLHLKHPATVPRTPAPDAADLR